MSNSKNVEFSPPYSDPNTSHSMNDVFLYMCEMLDESKVVAVRSWVKTIWDEDILCNIGVLENIKTVLQLHDKLEICLFFQECILDLGLVAN